MRFAIVTPYHKESRHLIERGIRSVRSQTVQTDHFLIADGHPQDWIDGVPVRHLKLDSEHDDGGNTPRGLGALLAIAEGYDGIGFLDADNWLERDHVEECLRAAETVPGGRAECDYVIAHRSFRRPDESLLPNCDEPGHVDTSCYFFLPGVYAVVPRWAMMPVAIAPLADRAFYKMLAGYPYRVAKTTKATVNYQCLIETIYTSLGEKPPEGARKPYDVSGPMNQWLASLTARDRQVAGRLMGLNLSNPGTAGGAAK